jgi:L-amino acid N-acyltransferase YncA
VPEPKLINLTLEEHGQQIMEIFNEVIKTSTALYEYQPRSMDTMKSWFETKAAGNFPVIGLVAQETLLGFASYGAFRPQPAYQYTVEHSVYVHPDHRGHGYGKLLLEELIQSARAEQMRSTIGVIDAQNLVSIRLHEQLGFKQVGMISEAGFKFDRWLDAAIYQLML